MCYQGMKENGFFFLKSSKKEPSKSLLNLVFKDNTV